MEYLYDKVRAKVCNRCLTAPNVSVEEARYVLNSGTAWCQTRRPKHISQGYKL